MASTLSDRHPSAHPLNCTYHVDQYPHECTCGLLFKEHTMHKAQAGERMMEMIPMPMELVVTDADKQAACDLIGTDTYGCPHWTVATISEHNRVVQAFALHRIVALKATP